MTTLDIREDSKNYAATVVRIENIRDIGMNTLNATSIFGYQALVSKDVEVGDIGIFFPAESQLSLPYAESNNLHRHTELNAQADAKPGFFEDSRRVKAIKLGGNVSNGFFTTLDTLGFLPSGVPDLTPGDTFTTIDGVEICRKYRVQEPKTQAERTAKAREKAQSRVDALHFPLHTDTEQYLRNEYKIGEHEFLTVTQKLHGTSIRLAHTYVNRKLTFLERIAKKLGVAVKDTEFGHVYGSRKVTKDETNVGSGYYGDGADIWIEWGEKTKHSIPLGYLVFGEVVGFLKDGRPIQKGYTYDLKPGESELYIYRVATISSRGYVEDLSWEAVKAFATERGLKHVPELWKGFKEDFNYEDYLDERYFETGAEGAIPLSDKKTVDEGVVIRAEGRNPFLTKLKSPKFFEFETKQLDAGTEDIESEESVA